jgi:hypothetical protein
LNASGPIVSLRQYKILQVRQSYFEQLLRVTVNLDVAADWRVRRGDERHRVVDVLVLFALQELAFHDVGVLLSGLVDRDAIVGQVVRDD